MTVEMTDKYKLCTHCGEKFYANTTAKYCFPCRDLVMEENKTERRRINRVNNKYKVCYAPIVWEEEK